MSFHQKKNSHDEKDKRDIRSASPNGGVEYGYDYRCGTFVHVCEGIKQGRDACRGMRQNQNDNRTMKEELYCVRFSGSKKFVGTYEECVAVADEVYRKTRVVLGIVKYNKQ